MRVKIKKLFVLCIVALTIIFLGVTSACEHGGGGAPSPTPTPHPGPEIFIEVDARMDKDSYLPGENVVIELSFKNVTSEPFQLEPFPPIVEVMRPSPYDEVVRLFPSGTVSKSLDPDEVATYCLTWDQSDDQGEQVPYGYYYIRLGHVRLGDRSMSLSLSGGRRLLVLPVEGVIEKNIEVNESRTANGITFTLEMVELSATEAKFYAFNVPPDYNLPQGPALAPPQLMALHAWAHFALDDGPTKEAGWSGIRFLDNGMRHTWDMLDPVPKGTKELTFVITKLADWEGPWKFQVLLE